MSCNSRPFSHSHLSPSYAYPAQLRRGTQSLPAAMEQFRRLFHKKPRFACNYCQDLYNGGVRIPAAELTSGSLAGCPACQLIYQSASTSDLRDSRIELVDARFFGDSVIQFTFDPKSDAMSQKLCSEEGKSLIVVSSKRWMERSCSTNTSSTRLQQGRLVRRQSRYFFADVFPCGATCGVVRRRRSIIHT